jgi:histidinol-phosphate/aromatic aminotransferase/cobyric acid decarboxylase-like protein
VRPGHAREHGADIYDASGLPRKVLDFSSTVASMAPPAAWLQVAKRALGRLLTYPQPRAEGLAAAIEKRLGLPEGSVLIGNGSSECLEWLARAAGGQKVLLEGPFFGEYLPMLQAAGAQPTGVSAAIQPARAALLDVLKQPTWKGAWAWTADPANPTGLSLEDEALALLLETARRRKVRLVLDEALAPQHLGPQRLDLARLAASRQGLFLVRSLSKGLSLPGLRLGYLVAHPAEIARLMPFTRPWNVNGLAQALGLWAFETERKLLPSRRRELALRKSDLLRKLLPLRAHGLLALPSDTGCFLLQLPKTGPDGRKLAERLQAKGILVRPCASFGKWGVRILRLNPRTPGDNTKLVSALAKAYAR